MSRKNWWSRQKALAKSAFMLPGMQDVSCGLILLRSSVGALLCFMVASALLSLAWVESLSFAVVMMIVFTAVNYTIEALIASYRHDLREQPSHRQSRALVRQPQYLTEEDLIKLRENLVGEDAPNLDQDTDYQHEIEEARLLFIGPASTWYKTLGELSRRRLEEASRYEQKLSSLELARRQENDESVKQLETQVDRIKLYLRDLQGAEEIMKGLMTEMGAKLDALLDVSSEDNPDPTLLWHRPVIARLGKLHGFIKKFPLHLPRAGEDVKLIRFSEEIELAASAFKDVYERSH